MMNFQWPRRLRRRRYDFTFNIPNFIPKMMISCEQNVDFIIILGRSGGEPCGSEGDFILKMMILY